MSGFNSHWGKKHDGEPPVDNSLPDEHRKNISNAQLGHDRLDSGHSKETKKLLSEIAEQRMPTGEDHWWYGTGGTSKYRPTTVRGRDARRRFLWWVRRRTDYVCEDCGDEHGPDSKMLDVHHIDGDQTNDMLDNLAVLCRSCHMKQHRGVN